MSCGTENIQLEPVDVYIGKNQAQKQKITCLADVSSSLNNKYFLIYDETGERMYVWFNVGAAGVDPALAGYTEIEVAIAVNATAQQVAAALQAALDAKTEFVATVSGKVVEVTNAAIGYATQAHDADIEASRTLFAFDMVVVGDTMEKVGMLDGDVELSGLSQEPLDVTAHQTGTTKLAQLLTGAGSPELAINLKEVTVDRIKKMRRYTSGEHLPVGQGSTPLVGGGLRGQFKPVLTTRVVLHPVSKEFADHSRDVCLWKCSVDLDTMTFSGENVLTLPVTVKANYDCSKPSPVSVWAYGDWTQVEAP